jgi:hemerythrin-like domain-containing protein
MMEKEEMSEMTGPNIAVDLMRIHRVITRGLQVGMEYSQSFARDGYPDVAAHEGFVSYVQALVAVLHGHHLGEDELAFPYFLDKLPDVPFDVLTKEHAQMGLLLDEANATLDEVREESQAGASLEDLNGVLTRLAGLWHAHIAKEENGLRPDVVGPMLDAEEHVRLSRMLAEHSQKHGGPDYLVVPFVLYNLGPEDRAVMSQAMPPIVTQQLVPLVWKEKWAPMKPFLLE